MEAQTTFVLLSLLLVGMTLECGCERRGRSPLFEEEPSPPPIEADLPRRPVTTESDGMEYLKRFGYVGTESQDPRTENIRDRSAIQEALRKFQRTAGIPETGELDAETKLMMSLPRCGVKDGDKSKRMKRYAQQGSKWDQHKLTYRLNSLSNDLPKDLQRHIFTRAFKAWSDVTPLTFTKKTQGKVDIDIEFARKEHGDMNPFDGQGNTLAHAFFPVFGGDAHFDEDELFTDNEHRGINLFQVAVHEFGHSLGLSHSENKDALMAPFYRGYQPNFKLHSDDILAIQSLYGPKPKPTSPAPTRGTGPTAVTTSVPSTTTPTLPTGACHSQFDAVATVTPRYSRAVTFAFSGEKYYILLNNKVNTRTIKDDFRIHSKVDAAIGLTSGYNSQLYIFAGTQMYVFVVSLTSSKGLRLYSNKGPYNIGSVIRGLPNNIDAIFRWSGNNNLYAFKGRQFYRIEGNRVARGYPRSISVWNLPDHVTKVDAVTQYAGRTFFFVGQVYYGYTDSKLQVARSYPRNIGQYWLFCQTSDIRVTDSSPPVADTLEDDGFIRVKTALQRESGATRTGGISCLVLTLLSVILVYIQTRL